MAEPLVWRDDLREAEEFLRRPVQTLSDEHRWLKNAISRIRSTLEEMLKRLAYDVFPPPPEKGRNNISLKQLRPELHKRWPRVQERWPEVQKESADGTNLETRVGAALSSISADCHLNKVPAGRADIEHWLNVSKEFLNVMVSEVEATAVER